MTKSSYDILQILLNDLTLWEPKNSNAINEQVNIAGIYDTKSQSDQDGADSYDSENPEMKLKPEGSFMSSRMLRPSLASVVVFMTKSIYKSPFFFFFVLIKNIMSYIEQGFEGN